MIGFLLATTLTILHLDKLFPQLCNIEAYKLWLFNVEICSKVYLFIASPSRIYGARKRINEHDATP